MIIAGFSLPSPPPLSPSPPSFSPSPPSFPSLLLPLPSLLPLPPSPPSQREDTELDDENLHALQQLYQRITQVNKQQVNKQQVNKNR